MVMTLKTEESGKLKPCPFCGCGAGLYQAYNSFWQVQCNVCNIGTLMTTDKETAISIWNRRVNRNQHDFAMPPKYKCIPVHSKCSHEEFKCPKCDDMLGKWDNYCSECGQRIDWSDFDEE